MAWEKQITEVSECHNKTILKKGRQTQKSLSVWESALLKLRFSRLETLHPVYLSCKASLSSASLSVLKFPIIMMTTSIAVKQDKS